MTPARYPPRSSAFYDPATELPRPVVGLDIDGTIGRYHEHFLTFAEAWLGKPMRSNYDGSVSLAKWMGVSKERYRKVKLAYRRGGLKRSMKTYPMASRFSNLVRKRGAVLVICTTRPFLMLENVDPDTQEFLRRNRIQYDSIIHGEHKYRDLRRTYGERVVSVVEDLPELIIQAEFHDCEPILVRRYHNRDYVPEPPIPAVNGLEMALPLVLERIDNYERARQ